MSCVRLEKPMLEYVKQIMMYVGCNNYAGMNRVTQDRLARIAASNQCVD